MDDMGGHHHSLLEQLLGEVCRSPELERYIVYRPGMCPSPGSQRDSDAESMLLGPGHAAFLLLSITDKAGTLNQSSFDSSLKITRMRESDSLLWFQVDRQEVSPLEVPTRPHWMELPVPLQVFGRPKFNWSLEPPCK